MIYLDYNATTPCDDEVVKAMLPYFSQKFGNAASRTHSFGWVADEAVVKARKQVAQLIHAVEQEIIFTSGATEGCNLALKGIYELYAVKGKHIITCLTEHKAVLDSCKSLAERGAEITYLPVDENGIIDLAVLENAIRPDTILIAIMYANNETGVVQDIAAIGRLAKKHNVIFFTDATQAVGKLTVDVEADNIDLMVFSAHKLYGPKGVGAMYIRRRGPRVRLMPQIDGGGHEKGFRSGTLNVPAIVGLGMACELSEKQLTQEQERIVVLRDKLENALAPYCITINGGRSKRLPHVSNLSFKGITAEKLVSLLQGDVAFSVGSACTSAKKEPSHVLAAMTEDEAVLNGAVRFSLGRFTTEAEIDKSIGLIKAIVASINI